MWGRIPSTQLEYTDPAAPCGHTRFKPHSLSRCSKGDLHRGAFRDEWVTSAWGAFDSCAPSRTSSQTPSDASPLHVSSQNIGGGGINGGGIKGGAGGVLGTGGEKPAVGAGGSGGGGEAGEAGDSGSGGGATGGGGDGEGGRGGVLGEGGSDGGGVGGCGGGGLGGGGSGLGMGTQMMPSRLQYSASHVLRISVSSVSSGPLRSSRTVIPKV